MLPAVGVAQRHRGAAGVGLPTAPSSIAADGIRSASATRRAVARSAFSVCVPAEQLAREPRRQVRLAPPPLGLERAAAREFGDRR